MNNEYNNKKKNLNKTAIALEYDPNTSDAPKVVATGKGALADKIIEEAKNAKVPVHKDSKLAKTLSKLEIGDMIPPELYEAVAEILVFVDAMEKIQAKQKGWCVLTTHHPHLNYHSVTGLKSVFSSSVISTPSPSGNWPFRMVEI